MIKVSYLNYDCNLLLLGVGIGFGYSALRAGLSVRRAGPCVCGLARAGRFNTSWACSAHCGATFRIPTCTALPQLTENTPARRGF
jgi:hypothetical protein